MINSDTEAPEGLILALDQGTTNTKAMLVEQGSGRVVSQASTPVAVRFPAPGEVEQDGEEIWNATLSAAAACLEGVAPERISGVTISNQRESVAMWNPATGQLLGPVLGWQDARTAAACRALDVSADLVRERTGLSLDPMYSAPKMRWLLEYLPAGPDVRLGTIDAFLLNRLTGEFVTEAGNASRTLLLNLHSVGWDEELLDLFEIPAHTLPRVVPSTGDFGVVNPGLPIPEGAPVLAVMADSHAALYCHSQGRAGEGKATYGTGSSIMVPTEAQIVPDGVTTTLAWHAGAPVYAREGNIIASGAALSLVARLLTGGDIAELGRLASAAPADHGVDFIPALSGLGAPYFDRNATGIIAGLTGATTREILARAAFDAVAHQVVDVVDAIESDGHSRLEFLHADGGATVSDLLMATQADLLARPVRVAGVAEASAMGAARLAADSLGVSTAQWADGADRTFTPSGADPSSARNRWKQSVRRSRGLSTTED